MSLNKKLPYCNSIYVILPNLASCALAPFFTPCPVFYPLHPAPLHRDGKYVMTERAIESGTSMTCGFCGCRDEHLGFDRMFKCHVCDLSIDRDVNGARNNGLQALADGGFGRPPEYWNTHA